MKNDSMTIAELNTLLTHGDEEGIYLKICDKSFDKIIPGMHTLADCDQGKIFHLEGDVARHTAKVISNLAKISSEDPDARFDFVDLLAALMHDVEKPSTRVEDAQGNVHFPGHEKKAAERVGEVARALDLNCDQQKKLEYLVGDHGLAHSLPTLDQELQQRVVGSPYWRNMRLLQKADAMSCYLNLEGSSHMPVLWDSFERLIS